MGDPFHKLHFNILVRFDAPVTLYVCKTANILDGSCSLGIIVLRSGRTEELLSSLPLALFQGQLICSTNWFCVANQVRYTPAASNTTVYPSPYTHSILSPTPQAAEQQNECLSLFATIGPSRSHNSPDLYGHNSPGRSRKLDRFYASQFQMCRTKSPFFNQALIVIFFFSPCMCN